MEEDNKLPLKRVELSLTKFNEVAIPHHLDLLRQHKANIIKHEAAGRLVRVRAEQTHARRVAAQLRALLGELAALRAQVRAADLPRFDALTQRSRDLTLRAIVDYLGTIERSCRSLVVAAERQMETPPLRMARAAPAEGAGEAHSAVSTDSVGVLRGEGEGEGEGEPEPELVQLFVDDHELALREREAVLAGWEELQREVRALHEVWRQAQGAARAQRPRVAAAADEVTRADANVAAARLTLSAAEKLKVGAYGAGGALVGALAGGPLGLAVGIKAGVAAALGGSLLGFVGGRFIGKSRQLQLEAPPVQASDEDAPKEKTQ